MSDIYGSFKSRGRTYKIVYSLGVMEKIQDEYGCFQTWVDMLGTESDGVKAVAFGLAAMIEAGGKWCTPDEALRILAVGNAGEIIKTIIDTVSLSVRDEEARVRLIPDEQDKEKTNFEWYKFMGTARLGYASHAEVMEHTLTYFYRLYRAYRKLYDLEMMLMKSTEETYESLEEKNENEELWLPL